MSIRWSTPRTAVVVLVMVLSGCAPDVGASAFRTAAAHTVGDAEAHPVTSAGRASL